MHERAARAAVFFAIALVANHARCVAACVANPCAQTPTPSCHHHKAPETKADRGCAVPATNDAVGGAPPVSLVATELAPVVVAIASSEAPPPEDFALGSPPGTQSVSVLRI